MLVLSRKTGEEIYLEIPPSNEPRFVRLTQVRIGPNTSRIGIDAPQDIDIRRGELAPLESVEAEPAAA